MNGETQSKILLIFIVSILALICGTIAAVFIHIDLPHESILEEIENETNISINDSLNMTNTTPQTTTQKKNYKSSSYSNYNKSGSSSSYSSSSESKNTQQSNSGSSSSESDDSSSDSNSKYKKTVTSEESD